MATTEEKTDTTETKYITQAATLTEKGIVFQFGRINGNFYEIT